MNRIFIAIFIVLELLLTHDIALAQSRSGEREDLRLAENAIVSRLALLNASPYICTDQPASCIGVDQTELALALIAARNTPESLRSFARLHRYVFDGALAETYDQLLCEKAANIQKYVAALKAKELREQCTAEFSAAVKRHPKELSTANIEFVCSSERHIELELDNTLKMVKNPPKSCEP